MQTQALGEWVRGSCRQAVVELDESLVEGGGGGGRTQAASSVEGAEPSLGAVEGNQAQLQGKAGVAGELRWQAGTIHPDNWGNTQNSS